MVTNYDIENAWLNTVRRFLGSCLHGGFQGTQGYLFLKWWKDSSLMYGNGGLTFWIAWRFSGFFRGDGQFSAESSEFSAKIPFFLSWVPLLLMSLDA